MVSEFMVVATQGYKRQI